MPRNAAHHRAAKQLNAAYQPGQPCPRCHQPIWPHQPRDAGHTDDQPASTGHPPTRLEHRSCNRAAGARISPGSFRYRTPRPIRRRNWYTS